MPGRMLVKDVPMSGIDLAGVNTVSGHKPAPDQRPLERPNCLPLLLGARGVHLQKVIVKHRESIQDGQGDAVRLGMGLPDLPPRAPYLVKDTGDRIGPHHVAPLVNVEAHEPASRSGD